MGMRYSVNVETGENEVVVGCYHILVEKLSNRSRRHAQSLLRDWPKAKLILD